jgi:hypothetical protein
VPAARADVIVSTGGPSGSYHQFFVDLKKVCGGEVELLELPSTGSDRNLENLLTKQADLAFVQSDTLRFQGTRDANVNEADLQTLVPLYGEEVHLIAKNAARVEGGLTVAGLNFGGKAVAVTSIEELKGMRVGAWGGSLTTAAAINLFGGVGAIIVPFSGPEPEVAAKAALDKGEIDVILAVGGQPLGFPKSLDASYRLLRIDKAKAGLMSFYAPATLSYGNLNASAVPTIAARAYLVTRNFRGALKRAELSKLKACIVTNLEELVEGRGYSPKWKEVRPDAATVWAKYETLPARSP